MKQISYKVYFDKVKAGWIGKSLGGIIGAPVESHKIKGTFASDTCWPSMIYPNDDLDIQVVWLELLEEKGFNISSYDMAKFWQERCWYNFAEYGFFLANVQRGINPPLSGSYNNDFYGECMGCPIRSEIWAMAFPANSSAAAMYAYYDATLDHKGNSVDAEVFWAVCESMAFINDDIIECFEAALEAIPTNSQIRDIYTRTINIFEEGNCFDDMWLKVVRLYGHRDNSKVEINFAFTLLAILIGDGDFKKTIVAAINMGWDADCTAATAGAFLGILRGMECIPTDWYDRMGHKLDCDVNVRYRNASINEFAEATCTVGIEKLLTDNSATLLVTDVPYSVQKKVEKAKNSRVISPFIITETYFEEPFIQVGESKNMTISIKNCAKNFVGVVSFTSDTLICVPSKMNIQLLANSTMEITLDIGLINPHVVWNKNLITLTLENEESIFTHEFGLIGAKQWILYGPYFDGYDTKVWKENPYRNENIITHPNNIKNCSDVMVHNYVDLAREYLCEQAIVSCEIPNQLPFAVFKGQDYIDSSDFGGFIGESCYYLVREIVSDKDLDCIAAFGRAAPMKIWIDGEVVFQCEKAVSWGVMDIRINVQFTKGLKKRFVIKLAQNADSSRTSLMFVRHDAGDKQKGVSYIIDCTGEVIF